MVHTDGAREEVFKIPRAYRVLSGGLCGMLATTIVHPLDVLKVRMQVFPDAKSTLGIAMGIVRCDGIPALYTGLSAGLMRQATYTTTRLGVYYWMYEEYRTIYGMGPPLFDKIMIGAYAGLVGAIVGNPSEVILVRMMADGRRDPSEKLCGRTQRYRGVFDAVSKITSTEGSFALWRGGTLTLTRSVCVSLAHIGTDTQAREVLRKRQLASGTTLHIYSAVMSSFLTACLTLPVDLVKTRYQFRREGMRVTHTDLLDDILRNKGFTYLWHGFFPYFIRLSLHTILMYILMDEFNENYIKHYQFTPKK